MREVVYVYSEELIPCQNPYCPTCTYGDPGELTSARKDWHAVDMSMPPATVPTGASVLTANTLPAPVNDDSPQKPGIKDGSYD